MGAQDTLEPEDLFYESYWAASQYPCNLVLPRLYDHQLQEFSELLDQQSDKLFSIDSAIDFLELDSHSGGFETASVYTYADLDTLLRLHHGSNDPLCRYIFINAPNARARLKTDRDMFVKILSYHQVMPSFLDFVVSFGQQKRAKDFHFCGFRSESTLGGDLPLLKLPSLRRSGRTISMCYSLRSVEKVEKASQAHWPWSIRQCAVYHSYDVETELATWVVVKANKLMRTRIRSLIKKESLYGKHPIEAECASLQATLKTHLLIASWSAEQWRWYINFLEERIQQASGQTLTESNDLASVEREVTAHRMGSRTGTRSEKDHGNTTSFDQLQDVHHLEEKTAEALLVVKADTNVLMSLKAFYDNTLLQFRKDERLEDDRIGPIEAFSRKLTELWKELTMQQHRLETLTSLLQGRMSLEKSWMVSYRLALTNLVQLRSMLQHRNTMMNLVLASESQSSASRVERVTKEMHSIAHSTKLETVSMRIITFVTLVYLPGTFVSTLMSTPIVTFEPSDFSHGHRHIDFEALGLFSAMSVPLLLLTVAVWWFFNRKEGQKDPSSEDQ